MILTDNGTKTIFENVELYKNSLSPSQAVQTLEMGNTIIVHMLDCPPLEVALHGRTIECREVGKEKWERGISLQFLFSSTLSLKES